MNKELPDEDDADRDYNLPPGVAARIDDIIAKKVIGEKKDEEEGAKEGKEDVDQPETEEKEASEDDVISAEEIEQLLKEAEAEIPADLYAQKAADVEVIVEAVAKLTLEPVEVGDA